jgi:hypothetical protein
MTTTALETALRADAGRLWYRLAPVGTLAVLAPVLAEVVFGATPLSRLWLLLPEIGCYGAAAVIIRALVRERGRGTLALVLLGVAFAVAEECVILQTSLGPLLGGDPQSRYGMALGVNWVYLLSMAGYESVWAIVLPIVLTELLVPARRDDPWLGRTGMIGAGLVFLAGAAAAWYSWTQIGVVRATGAPAPAASPLTVLGAMAAIAALGWLALRPPPVRAARPRPTRSAPRPVWVGLTAFGVGLLWFIGLGLAYAGVAPAVAIAFDLLVAGGAILLARRWSARAGWRDAHRLAIILGAYTVSMLFGFLAQAGPSFTALDRLGKLAIDVVALALLAALGWRLRRPEAAPFPTRDYEPAGASRQQTRLDPE